MNVLFAVYIQLWVISFQKTGVLESKEESDAIYRNIIIGSSVATIIALPFFGYMADKADARVIVPMAFLVRGLVAALFRFIESPKEWQGFMLCIFLVITSLLQFLAVEVVFMRNMKSTVRGTLSGIAFFFGSVGTTTFVIVGGIAFDTIAPWAPFMIVASADVFVFLVAIIFIASGLLGKHD